VGNASAAFGGQTDMFIMRVTNNDTDGLYSSVIPEVRGKAPSSRVLGMVTNHMLEWEGPTETATHLDWDGVFVDPQPPA
jgi:hypothetical protein